MPGSAQDTVLVVVGGTVLAIGATDTHLRYVKPSMQWLLIVSGVLLLLVGLRDVARTPEQRAAEGGGHSHHAPATAWLLLLPVLVMALVSPGALGSFSADRAPSRPPEQLSDGFPSLPVDRDGAVDLTLSEFSSRVAYAPATLEGRRVRMTGFVSPRADGWSLTRLQLSCCAADGRPIRVRAEGPMATTVPPRDDWVEVIGTAGPLQDGRGGEVTAGLVIDELTPVRAPTEQYE